eukprot:8359794-Alexandrium_andersonii.AAC.1
MHEHSTQLAPERARDHDTVECRRASEEGRAKSHQEEQTHAQRAENAQPGQQTRQPAESREWPAHAPQGA